MTDFDIKLGEIFARLRQERNYSQQYVADCMGVSKSTVHNWEKGKRQMSGIDWNAPKPSKTA